MGKRRKARELALMVLYELEFRPDPAATVLRDFWKSRVVPSDVQEFAESLVRGTAECAGEIDRIIQASATHWSLARIAPVERNILRLAAYELLHRDDVPERVAINEAIDLAKLYGSQESGAFVNGILDQIRLQLHRATPSPAPHADG
ncbi:MAG TPA: transcription antitermination factor NusB [Candidatus Sulfotelmatobacter sp.]|nr:transcription antitermination factor NusB [Candidatus Sulfotelmatobacter sp.]